MSSESPDYGCRIPFVMVFIGNHRYCFIYERGREEELISAMMDYAKDDRFNFGRPEFNSIIRHDPKLQKVQTQGPDGPTS